MTGSGSFGRNKEATIEQAIAFGRSRAWMHEHLKASDDEIQDAHQRIYQAHRAPDVDPAPPRQRRGKPTCGTASGARQHRRRKERTCDDCRAAEREAADEKRTTDPVIASRVAEMVAALNKSVGRRRDANGRWAA